MMVSQIHSGRSRTPRMDVAKLFARWREQPPEQLLGVANSYLPPGVTAVLVIAIAYQLAGLTWAPRQRRRRRHWAATARFQAPTCSACDRRNLQRPSRNPRWWTLQIPR